MLGLILAVFSAGVLLRVAALGRNAQIPHGELVYPMKLAVRAS